MFSSRCCTFKIPTINSTYSLVVNKLKELNYDLLLCEPENNIPYNEYEYNNHSALVVGNERFGINKKWFRETHRQIFIPMKNDVNSINVSVAASIIMFDAGIKKRKI